MRASEANPEKKAPQPTGGETLRQDAESMARAAALSGTHDIAPPELPGYDISYCLGGGAFGSVWLASEKNTGKQVAIKFYSHRRGVDWSLLNREVEKLAELYTCRDIVGLLKVGWDSDPPYYVMEYLENGSLAQLLEEGPLPVAEAVRIGTSVTQAVVHAHRSGILHCDLKPANVLLDRDFAPRLADFGQSRLSHEQNPALGTLFYMAPEQADLNAVPDPRWDVYALGALMYHCLCGEPPYRTSENEKKIQSATTLDDRLKQYREIISTSPRPKGLRLVRGIDQQLIEIVEHCLEPNPQKRYPTAEAVQKALESRARHRSRRPLIWLGVIGPIVLLCALVPLSLQAMHKANQTARKSLVKRALESDAVTARILALAVKTSLDHRMDRFVYYAGIPELRQAIKDADGPAATADSKERRDGQLRDMRRAENEFLQSRGARPDESWFLVDSKGTQVWRDPHSDKTVGKNFGFRAYFHGLGQDFDKEKLPPDIKPISLPYIAPPHASSDDGEFRVPLTVPIMDPEIQGKVIGVMGRSISVGSLLDEYQNVIRLTNSRDSVDRTIVLVDVEGAQGTILDHPWMADAKDGESAKTSHDLKERRTIASQLTPEQTNRLRHLRDMVQKGEPVTVEDRDDNYSDPIGLVDRDDAKQEYSMRWMAAFWPVQGTNWVAVVQEKSDPALRPVGEMWRGLLIYLVGGLALCCVLVAALWFFVLRALGRGPKHKFRRASGPGSQSPSTVTTTN